MTGPGVAAARLRPAAFIDRDGVINVERGYVHRVDDFEFIAGVPEGLLHLQALGFELVVVTNQSGLARGLYDEAAYAALTHHMERLLAAQGVRLAGVYHCPHHPEGSVLRYRMKCACRKPEPGLLLQAASDLQLELPRSVMVGDKLSDAQAGRAAGVRWSVLVESGHAIGGDTGGAADHRCASLPEAARWIASRLGDATA